jgi:hypothetical protein
MKEAKLKSMVDRCQKAGITPGSYDWNSMLANIVLGEVIKVLNPSSAKDNSFLQNKVSELYEEFL